jgi:hypothetical protein
MGPEAHQESFGEVGVAVGGPAVTDWRRRTSVPAGKKGDGDGYSGHPASIPSTGSLSAGRRSFSARRRRLRSFGTARAGGSHGGSAGARGVEKQRRGRARRKGRERR